MLKICLMDGDSYFVARVTREWKNAVALVVLDGEKVVLDNVLDNNDGELYATPRNGKHAGRKFESAAQYIAR